ncbi:unnamed protein product, partial [Allacma fusca]
MLPSNRSKRRKAAYAVGEMLQAIQDSESSENIELVLRKESTTSQVQATDDCNLIEINATLEESAFCLALTSDSSSNEQVITLPMHLELENQIAQWSINFNISHVSVNGLLKILQTNVDKNIH